MLTVPGVVRVCWPEKRLAIVRVKPNRDLRFDPHVLVGAQSLLRGDRVRVELQRIGRRYRVLSVQREISSPE